QLAPPPDPSPLSLHDALPICTTCSTCASSALCSLAPPDGLPIGLLQQRPTSPNTAHHPNALFCLLSTPSALTYDELAGGHGLASDRKSTRLNSSHVAISYAVF